MLVLLWLVILPIVTVYFFIYGLSYTLYKIIQLEIFKTFTESEIDLARIIVYAVRLKFNKGSMVELYIINVYLTKTYTQVNDRNLGRSFLINIENFLLKLLLYHSVILNCEI
jgi:hypothetical protein